MKTKIHRIWKIIRYGEELEVGFILSGVLAAVSDAFKPFIVLLTSKVLIEAVLEKTRYDVLFQKILILISVYFLLSLVVSFCTQQSQVHSKNFLRKHDMKKAVHLLNIDYEWTENEEMRKNIVELYNLETKNVFGFRPFVSYISRTAGGMTGILLALYFTYGFFQKEFSLGGLSKWTVNGGFILVFVGVFFLTLRINAGINKNFAKVIGGENLKILRFLKSYNQLIYRYQSGKDIRLYHQDLVKRYGTKYRYYMEKSHTFLSDVFTKSCALETLMTCLVLGVIYLFVGLKTIYGAVRFSEVLLYIGVFNQMIKQAMDLVDSLSCLYASDIYREKLLDYYATGEKRNFSGEESSKTSKASGIEVKNLFFSYPSSEKEVLKDISFEVKKGERLAIVGVNGSGKSTLVKLLMGLYSNYSGKISVEGKDIQKMDFHVHAEKFSPVFQDFKLLALTLKENLCAFQERSDEEIRKVMKETGLSEFYEKHGGDVYLSREFEEKGVEISGGEAQKIALARALLKDGAIFILDEPTAALDPISEYEIYKKFDSMTSGKTSIFISHRLSSCKFCDSILVLDEGRIVQRGSHDELLSEVKGKYKELWEAQAQYYQDDEKRWIES